MDKIKIENLRVFAHHGVFDFEKENGQDFYVNAVFFLPLQSCGIRDDLNLSVSYAELSTFISDYMTSHVFDLIETVAEKVAVAVLNEFELIQEVQIEIRKPNAPLQEEFESVSVEIIRKRHQAAIGIGSNMGDSKVHVSDSVKEIAKDGYCKVLKESEVIISTPYGGVEQNDFVNQVILIETYYEPMELLNFLHSIEKAHNRERLIHWGPRTLDLDIVLYDKLVMDTGELTIPHPDMCNRDFVMKPLNEIMPYYRHPVIGRVISDIAKDSKEKHIVE